MVLSFRLQLPAEAAYRPLAVDAASRLAEISGGTPTEAAAFSAAVDDALAGLAAGNGLVDLAFRAAAGALEAVVEYGGQARVLRGTVLDPKE
jgi:hypothetical protein